MTTPENNFASYLTKLKGTLDDLPLGDLQRAADIIFHAYQNDRSVILFGNGGSAALASHLATDLAKGTHFPGPVSLKNVAATDRLIGCHTAGSASVVPGPS